ncbi:MAG TPA: VOC family protein [Streptosporangiaceae bacterium]|nr:VOC family protein [Streptosporangiaceae bacterium]
MSSATTPTVIPSLRYTDARKAIQWLVDAFGFTASLVVDGEGDTVAHAQLTYGSGMVMLGSVSDGSDGRLATEQGPAGIYVVVDDIEAHYATAREAGAEIIQELREEGYGGQGYTARDPEKNVWSFGTYQPSMD